MEAKPEVASYLHPAALQWASDRKGGFCTEKACSCLSPIATQWHWAGSQACANRGGNVASSCWLLGVRISEAENQEAQRSVKG